MRVTVSNMVWIDKSELRPGQLDVIRKRLTIIPKKVGEYPGDEDPKPIEMWKETLTQVGIPRGYFFLNASGQHDTSVEVSDGALGIPYPLEFHGILREDQSNALSEVVARLRSGKGPDAFGGLFQAAPGYGKTVWTCAVIATLQVPVVVVVHKEFLLAQWRERIQQFLPNALVGIAQQDTCDYVGKHIVLGMVHSLASHAYPDKFWKFPGLVVTDECHRIGAYTWSPVPSRFYARWQLGLSATLRRKDGAEDVFWNNFGSILYAAAEKRMRPKVRRVHTTFEIVKTPSFDPSRAPRALLIRFLTKNITRNTAIAQQMILAIKAGRKLLVLSERLEHLDLVRKRVEELWDSRDGSIPSFGKYVGGRTQEQLNVAATAQVVLATIQFAAEGLDIPPLDTLFLTTPVSDVEQAVGRILRPFEGKKDPVVVDFRDDRVAVFRRSAEYREAIYARLMA